MADGLPGFGIDDADHAFIEIRRRHHRPSLPLPGDARAKMRHAGQGEVGDFLACIEIDDLPLAGFARGAHYLVVALGEEEIVEIIIELAALRMQKGRHESAFAILEIMDGAGRYFRRGRVVGNLPDFL